MAEDEYVVIIGGVMCEMAVHEGDMDKRGVLCVLVVRIREGSVWW